MMNNLLSMEPNQTTQDVQDGTSLPDESIFEFHGNFPSSYLWECEVDGNWKEYNNETNLLIERAYRRGNPKIAIEIIVGSNHMKSYEIDLKLMTQKSLNSGKSRPVRNKYIGLRKATIIYLSAEERGRMITKLLNRIEQFSSLSSCNVGLLHNAMRMMNGYDLVVFGEKIDLFSVALQYIEQFPNEMRGYAWLWSLDDRPDTITLLNGETVDGNWLYEKAMEYCSVGDAFAWYRMSFAKGISEEQKNLFKRNAFELGGGSNRDFNMFSDCLEIGVQMNSKDCMHHHINIINMLQPFLMNNKLPLYELHDFIFSPDVHSCNLGSTHIWKALANSYFELAGLLKAHPEEAGNIIIDGMPTISSNELVKKGKSFGKEIISERIYLVNGVDNERSAWYYVLVTGSVKVFKVALNDDIIHLEDHGEIIKSAYGNDPPATLKQAVNNEYGINSTGYLIGSVKHLRNCLRGVQTVDCFTAVQMMTALDLRILGNPSLRHPSVEILQEMYHTASAKRVDVPTWSSEEPHKSYKDVLVMCTMERPYRLFDIVNAPFNTRYVFPFQIIHHKPFMMLICRALRALPVRFQFTATMYRGIRIGTNKQLQKLVDNAENSFKAGELLTFPGLTRATRNREVAARYTDGLLIEITNARGYNIRPFCTTMSELEMLLAPPLVLTVVSWSKTENVVTVVTRVNASNSISYT